MPYRANLPNGAQGPVNPDDPNDALAALLGINGDPSAAAPDPALDLANLRGSRADELKVRMAKDAMAGDKNDFSGSKILLDMLQGDMANDPTTGTAAHQAAAKAAEDEYQANGMLPNQVRNDAREFDLKKTGEAARVAGTFGNQREEIAQEGAQERQRIANEGLIGAAAAKAGASQNKPLPSGLLERVAGGSQALSIMDRLQKDPKLDDYVGPLAGRFHTLMQNIPLIPGDSGFADFKADSENLKNATIKAITGAQMSQAEVPRILGQVPTTEDKPEVWRSKATSAARNIRGLNTRISLLQAGVPASVLDAIPLDQVENYANQLFQQHAGTASPFAGSQGSPQNDDVISDPNWGAQ